MKTNLTRDTLYWSLARFGESFAYIAATEQGLSFVGSLDGSYEEMTSRLANRYDIADLVRDDGKLHAYGTELADYWTGARTGFDSRFDLRGTPFQLRVWAALLDIPYGETRSYSEIASAIGSPAAVRAVGSAIGANPVLIAVPCHRVVGKNGTLTGYRGGLAMKQKLLRLEQDAAFRETRHEYAGRL
ncbi:methylated-DNA--[protein]-cysteine S-methyltransferase [Paenibacillus sp. LHD-117]|uniref:methylated-DNA--[protein]-cysteine S-methyltransferase n=1 Tax=Paenibacillus sp. LHD-117 TaxID=3071412 RepID=UPI0027DFE5C6|nr:methylated-DNA--[protein]-cysteine S-methyltransferase [Paenibacillus sp. LHD-117]MDQ6421538.1 methylated-DNA--[protein]-cysteine S-methyltransferase [Paenibacillus sp. LHD-117]